MEQDGIAEVIRSGGLDLVTHGEAVVEPQRHLPAAHGDQPNLVQLSDLRQGEGERFLRVGLCGDGAVKAGRTAGLRRDGQAERGDHVDEVQPRPGTRGVARAGAGDGGAEREVAITRKHEHLRHGEDFRPIDRPRVRGGEADAFDGAGLKSRDEGETAGIGKVGCGLIQDEVSAALVVEDLQLEAHGKAVTGDDGVRPLCERRHEHDGVRPGRFFERELEPAHILLGGVTGLEAHAQTAVDEHQLRQGGELPVMRLDAGFEGFKFMPGPEGQAFRPVRIHRPGGGE